MPRGETEQDRKNQHEILQTVIAANPDRYDDFLFLNPFNYRLDYCLHKKEQWYPVPKLFAEAKQCTKPFRYYRSYHISIGKLIAANWLLKATGLKSALFVRFSDGIVAGVRFIDHSGRFVINGRTDRPEFEFDIEPMVEFDWDKFKIIRSP